MGRLLLLMGIASRIGTITVLMQERREEKQKCHVISCVALETASALFLFQLVASFLNVH